MAESIFRDAAPERLPTPEQLDRVVRVSRPLGFWQARTTFHDGKRSVKSFSVLEYGDREAY